MLVARVAGDQGHIALMQAFMRLLVDVHIDRDYLKTHLRQFAHDAHARMPNTDNNDVPPKC